MTRRVWLLGVALALLLTLQGTSGYTAVAGDRSVQIAVAPDDQAYLGVDSEDRTLPVGHNEDVQLLTLTNNAPTRLTDVQVRIDDGTGPPPIISDRATVGPTGSSVPVGESVAVTADVTCAPGHKEQFKLYVTATNNTFRSELSRTVTVHCEQPPGEPDRSSNRSLTGETNRE